MSKATIVLSCVVLFSLVVNVSAVSWDNDSGDNLWSNPVNWSGNSLPTLSDGVQITISSGPVINSPTTALGFQVRVGGSSGANLTMNGGTLNSAEWLMIGIDASGNPGTFTMNDGTINLGTSAPGNGHLWMGYTSSGTFMMNGGTINVPGRFGLSWLGGSAVVYLDGGTISTNQFSMTSSSLIDITNGTLIINGDQTTIVDTYVGSGWIIAFGSDGTVVRDFDVTNPGKTTVTAYLDLAKAGNPNPTNGIDDVLPDAILSWSAGEGAISHDVYFGTSAPPAFIRNQTETTYDPCGLDLNTTHYWRIDEVNGLDTVTGDLWTFTTASGSAYEPDPVNGAMNVARDKILSWTAGYGAVSHDVYFGTDANGVGAAERLTGDLDGSGTVDYNDLFILTDYWAQDPFGSEPYAGVNGDNIVDFTDYAMLVKNYMGQPSPWFKGNTSATSYDYDDPCDFELDTTYYWRVDEIVGKEKRKGSVWSFTSTASDSNYSLVGKVMCGYQGWFNCPGDGIPRGWVHWGTYIGGGTFTPDECTVDMWPDMTEMDANEKFLASAFYDGTDHYVFSSHNYDTVVRHFQWMSDYGIDGVYLQRFATETTPNTPWCDHRNDVLSYCKAGANLYGKKYAVMYDLSGLGSGSDIQKVVDDWKYLLNTMQVTRDVSDMGYMTHNGQPVVAVWGLGFNRSYEGQATRDLIDFLKNDPTYGGNVVMIGVNDDWRLNSDSWFQQTLQLADIISPWWVGRFGDTAGAYSWASGTGVPDKAWCDTNGKEYLPVMFPGFSWYNMGNGPFNQIPRNGGQFLWDQVYSHINTVGATMLYVAMFDEVDEGTAIFKVTNDPPVVSPAMFVTYDPLPSDEYLWLVGQATRALRGEIPAEQTRPAR